MVDLENIHNNIPSIEDLCLDCITVEAGDIPSKIMPATLNTKLEFDYFNTRNIEAQFINTSLKNTPTSLTLNVKIEHKNFMNPAIKGTSMLMVFLTFSSLLVQ
jgi:hypothetical protein